MSFVNLLLKIFKDPYERKVNKIMPIVEHINSLEPEYIKMSDEDLRAKTAEFRAFLAQRPTSEDLAKDKALEKETLDKILPEAFATVREAGRRVLNMRHFDVQLIGGIFLHEGYIAEMRTGEGKTLVATLSAYLNALSGKGVHIVTVNDYLAQRDRDWMGKIYEFLGLSIGVILSSARNDSDVDEFELKKEAYACDITYGTNNEFGFDYLRDNMSSSIENCVQRPFNYAIIDEVDSILIDEARTPLIISGRLEKSAQTYLIMSKIAPQLVKAVETTNEKGEKVKVGDYEVDEKNKNIILTEDGIDKAQELLGVSELFDIQTQYAHHLLQALKAKELFVNDTDYVVRNNEVMIVDEFTGRIMDGRRWSEGLHQAVEAKEGVPIQDETQTLASVTFQNLFRLYPKLSGMTGTAMTEEAEFGKIYNLPVMPIPTNKPDIRINQPDVIYKTRERKYISVAEDIEVMTKTGRPILVGTISIEKSELLSHLLKEKGIKHHVLNAKHHAKEAYIIAQAGRLNAVTIATNMAGRGTDILLGGNPEYLAKEDLETKGIFEDSPNYEELKDDALRRAREITENEHDEVVKQGGLYVIGTERHESRRIDNQLRGRAARQGDPGSTKFFLSLEDDLMRIFGGEKITNVMNMLKVDEKTAIESGLISRQIESAQKKVETYHFDIRKNVLEYDDVINIQREKFYEQRRKVLLGRDLHSDIQFMLTKEVDKILAQYVSPEMSPQEYNLEDLTTMMSEIHSVFVQLKDLKLEDLKDLRFAQMSEKLRSLVLDAYKKHEEESIIEFNEVLSRFSPNAQFHQAFADDNIMRHVEKDILLQVVDAKWIDHLNNIDALKDGIGLVAYGQKDPLIEYKKEAFNYFNAMMSDIQSETVRHILRAKFGVQIIEEADESAQVETELTRALKHSSSNMADEEDSHEFEDVKIGRNDACPCGSGKKYKKCCGLNK